MAIISYDREIEEKKLATLKAKLNDLSYHDHILRKEMNMLDLDDDKRDDYISDIKYNIRCIQDTEDAIRKQKKFIQQAEEAEAKIKAVINELEIPSNQYTLPYYRDRETKEKNDFEEICYSKTEIQASKPDLEYEKKSLKQIIYGNYTDDVTALGTIGQVALGFTGIDFLADIRDFYHDIDHWKWTWGHVGNTTLDLVGLVPLVGVLKNADEVTTLLKSGKKTQQALEGVSDASKTADKLSDVSDAKKQIDNAIKGANESTSSFQMFDNKLVPVELGPQGFFDSNLNKIENVPKNEIQKNYLEAIEGAGDGSKGVDNVTKGTSNLKYLVNEDALKHAIVGDFTVDPKTGDLLRMKGGGHGQDNIDFLINNGFEYNIEKTYSNGVRVGNVPLHKTKGKRIGIGQAWFPESWISTDIAKAGEYVANLAENLDAVDGQKIYGIYNDVEVIVIKTDGEIGTIFPNNIQP